MSVSHMRYTLATPCYSRGWHRGPMSAALPCEPPTDYEPLLLWLSPSLKRELRRRARRMLMLEHEIAVEVLRTALLTNETPATPTKEPAGARKSNGRTRSKS